MGSDTPVAQVNGVDLFISVEAILIGFNPENADMTYPNGEIWGRSYVVSAHTEEGCFLLSAHDGLREEGLDGAVSDVAFYSELPDFNPSLVAGSHFESNQSSYDWADVQEPRY